MIQHIVILIAMTVNIERIPSKVSKGKRHTGKFQGNQTQLPRVFSQGSHQQPVVITHVKCYLSETLVRDLGFYSGLVTEATSVPEFQSPRRKAGVQHKYLVCTIQIQGAALIWE